MIYRHKKSGNLYRMFNARDCTNARDGNPVVVYHRVDISGGIYVRDKSEWDEKFEPVSAEEKNEIIC